MHGMMLAGALRGLGFLAFWFVLGGSGAGLLAGLVAAAVAAWLSLRLLPPAPHQLRPAAAVLALLHFLRQSALGGIDVARRALDPRMPLEPGLVACRVRLPPGPARNAFRAEISLLPGTLVVAAEGDTLTIHCLDCHRPIIAALADEEGLLAHALGRPSGPADV
jgi:multicomponent Na+:H+ antiporter subunit E